MPRPFHYHVFDHPDFDDPTKLDGDGAIELQVPINAHDPRGNKEPKRFYSLRRDLDDLRKKGAAKNVVDATFTSAGSSLQGRALAGIQIGRGKGAPVLICGCHHSREWISLELAYYVAEYLVNTFTDSPTTDNEKRIKHLLGNRSVFIVPLVNPDGHNVTITDNRFWRPNVREISVPSDVTFHVDKRHPRDITIPANKVFTGIDINRNYGTATWGEETYQAADVNFQFPATSRNPADAGFGSTFCGLTPASEPETQAMTALMQAQSFQAFITFHSFGQQWIAPNDVKGNDFLEDHKSGLDQLVNQYKNPYHFLLSSEYAYETSGDAMDRFLEISPNRPTYTPEVRPRETPRPPESAEFSGLPESEIEPCFKENLAAALALINGAPFSAKAQSVSVSASAAAPTCQVVTNYWKAFVDWQP